jgi:adenosine deaminase
MTRQNDKWIVAVGLDSLEEGNPPSKFAPVFEVARQNGLKIVAHGGETSDPIPYISELIDMSVDRIDHGITCIKDETIMKKLLANNIPLTVCPLSNVVLNVVPSLKGIR